jgi:hypothetical protein
MIIPREKIYAALFALGQSVSWQWNAQTQTWAVSSRHLVNWTQAPGQPAFYQRQIRQRPTQQRGQGGGYGTTKWTLYVQWWIYLQAPNADGQPPSTYMNVVEDAIDKILQNPTASPAVPGPVKLYGLPGQGQTLQAFNGGVPLVENVYIEGEVIEKDPVNPDTQIVVIIPITISTGL